MTTFTARQHRKTRALIDRYLRVDRSWDGKRDVAMRDHLRECDECAVEYDRRVTVHRLLVGAEEWMPSAFEQRRMMEASLEQATGVAAKAGLRPIPTPGPAWWAFGAAVAAALVFFVVRPTVVTSPASGEDLEDYVGARGSGIYDLSVGIGLSGVTRQGREYEVVANGTNAYLDDWLRISTTRVVDAYPYVFIFGLQDGREPLWYYPDPDHDEQRSQPAPYGRAIPIGPTDEPFEFELKKRHVDGPLTVVAIFSEEPLTVEQVAQGLEGRSAPIEVSPVMGFAGHGDRRFASDTIIRILEVAIVPGTREDLDAQ